MRATLADLQVSLIPGTPGSIVIDLVNTEAEIDGVAVTVRGIDPAYVSVNPPLLSLFPTTSATVTVTFTVPPSYPSGETPVMVVATSTVDPSRIVEHDVLLHVGEVHSARVDMRPSVVTGGKQARFIAEVRNTGNAADEVRVSAVESSRTLQCRVTPQLQPVLARQTAPFVIDVRGKRPWFGQITPRTIKVLVDTGHEQLETEARFQQKPRIPWGVITALILALIVALWATIFILVISMMRNDSSRSKAVPANWNEHGVQAVPLDLIAASMTGTVRAASTGAPLPRITVTAFRLKPENGAMTSESSGSAATDDDGVYNLTGLLPGNYQLHFSADGYEPAWYPSGADQATAQTITAAPLAQLKNLDMTIAGKPGALRGTIALPPGANPNIPVTITVTAVPQNPNDPVPPPQVVTTTGPFDVSGLPTPGTYSVRVDRPGFDPQTFTVTLDGGASPPIEPDQLLAAPGSVSGTVVTSSGQPLGGVTVTVRGGTTELVSTTPTTGAVGAFTVPNLPTPGTYVLTFEKDGFAAATIALDLTGGASQTGLRAVLQGGVGTVTGMVRDTAGNPLGGVSISATGSSTAATSSLTGGGGTTGPGSYSMTGLRAPGTYTFAFTMAGFEPATIPVTLDGTGALSGVDVVMLASNGGVRGTAMINGVPTSGLSIVLSDGVTKLTTMSSSSPAGGYQFVGVVPGDYTVTVSGTLASTANSAPTLRQTVLQTQVTAGGLATVDIDLAAGAAP